MKYFQVLNKTRQKEDYSKSIIVKSGQTKNLETITQITSSHTLSNIVIKAVVMPNSSLVIKGIIKVSSNLVGIEAFLKHNILLVGKNSTAVSIPELEIESNDVKVAHASSIGQIDSDQLFYLMSRGFSRLESIKLIIKSFLFPN